MWGRLRAKVNNRIEPKGLHQSPPRHIKDLRRCSSRTGNRKAIRVAHVSAHLFDPFEKRWQRVQGDAGTATPFNNTFNPGRVHASDQTCQTECTGRCNVFGLLRCSMKSGRIYKDAALGGFWVQTQFCPFLFAKSSRKLFGMYGGDDGAQTRDLCRDRHRCYRSEACLNVGVRPVACRNRPESGSPRSLAFQRSVRIIPGADGHSGDIGSHSIWLSGARSPSPSFGNFLHSHRSQDPTGGR